MYFETKFAKNEKVIYTMKHIPLHDDILLTELDNATSRAALIDDVRDLWIFVWASRFIPFLSYCIMKL